MKKLAEWAVIVFFVYAAVGCGGGGGGGNPGQGGTPGPVSVRVSPPTTSGTLGDTVNFSAQVSGSGNQAVTWTIQEAPAGGAISSTGVYTAPAVPGVYHIVATSQADPSKSALATIVIRAGSGTINIQ
jgi:chitinase